MGKLVTAKEDKRGSVRLETYNVDPAPALMISLSDTDWLLAAALFDF